MKNFQIKFKEKQLLNDKETINFKIYSGAYYEANDIDALAEHNVDSISYLYTYLTQYSNKVYTEKKRIPLFWPVNKLEKDTEAGIILYDFDNVPRGKLKNIYNQFKRKDITSFFYTTSSHLSAKYDGNEAFRIIIPLKQPIKNPEQYLKDSRMTRYERAGRALLSLKDIEVGPDDIDQSCYETYRGFFFPAKLKNHQPVKFYGHIGELVDIVTLDKHNISPKAPKQKHKTFDYDSTTVLIQDGHKSIDLNKWWRSNGYKINLDELLEPVVDVVGSRRSGKTGLHFVCPNCHNHTDGNCDADSDNTATFVDKVSDHNHAPVIHCLHNHCRDTSTPEFLKMMIESDNFKLSFRDLNKLSVDSKLRNIADKVRNKMPKAASVVNLDIVRNNKAQNKPLLQSDIYEDEDEDGDDKYEQEDLGEEKGSSLISFFELENDTSEIDSVDPSKEYEGRTVASLPGIKADRLSTYQKFSQFIPYLEKHHKYVMKYISKIDGQLIKATSLEVKDSLYQVTVKSKIKHLGKEHGINYKIAKILSACKLSKEQDLALRIYIRGIEYDIQKLYQMYGAQKSIAKEVGQLARMYNITHRQAQLCINDFHILRLTEEFKVPHGTDNYGFKKAFNTLLNNYVPFFSSATPGGSSTGFEYVNRELLNNTGILAKGMSEDVTTLGMQYSGYVMEPKGGSGGKEGGQSLFEYFESLPMTEGPYRGIYCIPERPSGEVDPNHKNIFLDKLNTYDPDNVVKPLSRKSFNFNSWLENEMKVFLDVMAAGNESAFHYILTHLAHAHQRPWEKPHTAMMFYGPKGAGKTLLTEYMIARPLAPFVDKSKSLSKLFGATTKDEPRFNPFLANNFYIIADESSRYVNLDKDESFKFFITNPSIEIEGKHVNGVQIPSVHRLYMMANEVNMYVPDDERRISFFKIDGKHIGNSDLFSKFVSNNNNSKFNRAMRTFFLEYNPEDYGYDWTSPFKPFDNTERQNLMNVSMTLPEKLIVKIAISGQLPIEVSKVCRMPNKSGWGMDQNLVINSNTLPLMVENFISNKSGRGSWKTIDQTMNQLNSFMQSIKMKSFDRFRCTKAEAGFSVNSTDSKVMVYKLPIRRKLLKALYKNGKITKYDLPCSIKELSEKSDEQQPVYLK